MARLRPSLSVITAIATLTLLLGSSITVQACPFKDSGRGLDGAFSQSSMSSRLPNAARLPDNSRQSSMLDHSEVAGLGVLVGLFTIAILSKVRHARKLAPCEAAFLSKDPLLEHPEMVLALVPQEAWSSAFETEVVSTRW